MNESILDSIKKLLGIDKECTDFDKDIIIHINSVFMILNQIGIGPETGYSISSNVEKWNDFTKNDTKIESVKSYVYLKVRLLFDPPLSSSVSKAINENIKELEWRLSITPTSK